MRKGERRLLLYSAALREKTLEAREKEASAPSFPERRGDRSYSRDGRIGVFSALHVSERSKEPDLKDTAMSSDRGRQRAIFPAVQGRNKILSDFLRSHGSREKNRVEKTGELR